MDWNETIQKLNAMEAKRRRLRQVTHEITELTGFILNDEQALRLRSLQEEEDRLDAELNKLLGED